MTYLSFPLKLMTLFLECGAVLFFLHRKMPRIFIASWILFHLGVFFMSGICFWIWVTLDMSLLFLFLNRNAFATLPIFTRNHFFAGMILILTSPFWCKPVQLAWYDLPLSYTFHFTATTESGKTYPLPPKFFAPYDYQFTLASFNYLSEKPFLELSHGVTAKQELLRWFTEERSKEEILAYEKSNGKVEYDPARIQAIEAFIQTYLQNWNQRLSKATSLSFFQAPRLLWTFPSEPGMEIPKRIEKVAVFQTTTFFQTGKYEVIRQELLHEIAIEE